MPKVTKMTVEELIKEAQRLNEEKRPEHSTYVDSTKRLMVELKYDLRKACVTIGDIEGWSDKRVDTYYRHCLRVEKMKGYGREESSLEGSVSTT